METEAGGEEDVRGNTDDAAATEEGAGADVPAGEEGQGSGGGHRGRAHCDDRRRARDHPAGSGHHFAEQPSAQPPA